MDQEVKLKCHQLLLQHLVQNEEIVQQVFLSVEPYIQKKKQDPHFMLRTNFRLFLIKQSNMHLFSKYPLLLSDFQGIDKAGRLVELKLKEGKGKQETKKILLQPKAWPDIVFMVSVGDEENKLRKLFEQIDTTIIFEEELKRKLFNSQIEIKELYKQLVVDKNEGMIKEEVFWENCVEYNKQVPDIYSVEQQHQVKNAEELNRRLVMNLPVYPKGHSQPQLYQSSFSDEIHKNLETENDSFKRVKLTLKNEQSLNEKPNDKHSDVEKLKQQFEQIEVQLQINSRLNNNFVQHFGQEIINKLGQKEPTVTRILDDNYIHKISHSNDGVEIKLPQHHHTPIIQEPIIRKKVPKPNQEWEKEKREVLISLNSQTESIEKIELKQAIIEDYKLGFEVSQKQKQKQEDKEVEFYKEIRQLSSDVRRLLQYLYDGMNKEKKDNNSLKEIWNNLDAAQTKITSKIQNDYNSTDRFKFQLLDDQRRMIDRAKQFLTEV